MANTAEYPLAVNNIVYKAKGFQVGLDVTVRMWTPDLVPIDLITLDELGYGLYSFTYDFHHQVGVYNSVYFEDGEPSVMWAYRIVYQSFSTR